MAAQAIGPRGCGCTRTIIVRMDSAFYDAACSARSAARARLRPVPMNSSPRRHRRRRRRELDADPYPQRSGTTAGLLGLRRRGRRPVTAFTSKGRPSARSSAGSATRTEAAEGWTSCSPPAHHAAPPPRRRRGAPHQRRGQSPADALIAAGATVLAVQRISQRDGVVVTTAVAIIGVLSVLCVGFSVTFAAWAIANIRPWQSVVKESIPRGIFFDASDTASAVESFQEFEYLLNDADEDAILRYATINLWKCIMGYRSRYARLRISLRFLLAALWIFLSAVVLQFAALALRF